jgi:tetratricopeptide (TPR) repeat protein
MRLRGIDRSGGNLRTRWRRGLAAAFLILALCGPQGSLSAEARDLLSGLFDLPFGDGGGRSYRGYSAPQGPDTVAIQNALTELGYNTGEADGQSGQKTRDAILLWQRDNGRDPTGALTPDQAAELMTGQEIRRYDAAIENEPRNSEARVGRAAALILRGDLDKARKDFQDAVEADPDNAEAYYGQGFLLAAAGEATDALELYKKAVELLKQRQQQQREQQQQQQVVQLQQRHQQEQQQLERQQQRQLQYTQQQAQPQVLQRQEQQRQDLQKQQEQELQELRRRQQQQQPSRQDLPAGSHASLYNDLGWLYAGLGRYEEAAPYIDRALELNPNSAIAYSNRCWIRLQSGDVRTALSDCNLAAGRLDGVSASVRSAVLARRSLVFQALGQTALASSDAARAVSENPLSLVGFLARAQANEALGDKFGASSDCQLVQIIASPAAGKSFYHQKLLDIAARQLVRIGPQAEPDPKQFQPGDLFMGGNNRKFFLCLAGGRERCVLSQINMVIGRGTPDDGKRINEVISRLNGLRGLPAPAVKAGLTAFSVVMVKAEGVQAIQAGKTDTLASFIAGERRLNLGMEIPKTVLTADARALAALEGMATGLEGFLALGAKDAPGAPRLVVSAAAAVAALYGGYNINENMAAFSNLLRAKGSPVKS